MASNGVNLAMGIDYTPFINDLNKAFNSFTSVTDKMQSLGEIQMRVKKESLQKAVSDYKSAVNQIQGLTGQIRIFSRVIEHKGNVWKVQSIGKEDTMYIVTDGSGRYAHGETIKAAKADLIYKISNRDKSKYESLTLDSEVTFEEAIEMYRVITGACAAGTKNFVENRLREKKEKYTIAEIIELTKGEYQADAFADYFNK